MTLQLFNVNKCYHFWPASYCCSLFLLPPWCPLLSSEAGSLVFFPLKSECKEIPQISPARHLCISITVMDHYSHTAQLFPHTNSVESWGNGESMCSHIRICLLPAEQLRLECDYVETSTQGATWTRWSGRHHLALNSFAQLFGSPMGSDLENQGRDRFLCTVCAYIKRPSEEQNHLLNGLFSVSIVLFPWPRIPCPHASQPVCLLTYFGPILYFGCLLNTAWKLLANYPCILYLFYFLWFTIQINTVLSVKFEKIAARSALLFLTVCVFLSEKYVVYVCK